MEIKLSSVESDLICVSCRGFIRQSLSADARDPLQLVNQPSWAGHVLLNLREAEYIDSSGIAWLLQLYRQVQKTGRVFALCEVPPRIADVLHLCHLDRVFSIWKDEASARAGLAAAARDSRPSPPATPREGTTEGA